MPNGNSMPYPPMGVSDVVTPSHCPMFWDQPAWRPKPDAPGVVTNVAHNIGNNVAYFDGHVKSINVGSGTWMVERLAEGFGTLPYIW